MPRNLNEITFMNSATEGPFFLVSRNGLHTLTPALSLPHREREDYETRKGGVRMCQLIWKTKKRANTSERKKARGFSETLFSAFVFDPTRRRTIAIQDCHLFAMKQKYKSSDKQERFDGRRDTETVRLCEYPFFNHKNKCTAEINPDKIDPKRCTVI